MSEVTFPERWISSRIKHVSSLKGRLGWQGLKAEEYRDDGPYVVSSAHFRNDRIVWQMCPHVSWERYRLDANIQLGDGDVLLMKDGAALGKLAFLDRLPGPACLNSHLLLFRPIRGAYVPKFLYYYMSTTFFQGYILIRGTGATFLGVSQETIGNHEVTLPPRQEQHAIAAFLDRKTAAIDALIAKKERLIELLQEQRQALITQVATKGLDPGVPLKESAIAWLGEIPSHWLVTRLGFVSHALDTGPFGSQLHADEYIEGGVPVVNPANLVDGRLVADPSKTVPALIRDRLCRHVIRTGDILIGRRGEMGRCGVVRPNQAGWLCGTGCLRVRLDPRRCVADYLGYYVGLDAIGEWLSLNSVGSTMENLNTSILGRIPVVLPPRADQELIVGAVERMTQRFERSLRLTQQSVLRLREYRQALITAAVTGKIDVSKGEAVSETEESRGG